MFWRSSLIRKSKKILKLMQFIGLIILKLFTDNNELGKFALANRVALLIRMIPVFIIQSVLQNASVINKNNNSNLNKYLNYYYSRGLFVTFIIGLFFTLFSKWIIILFSGEEIISTAGSSCFVTDDIIIVLS